VGWAFRTDGGDKCIQEDNIKINLEEMGRRLWI
jgi:hypothetical protein